MIHLAMASKILKLTETNDSSETYSDTSKIPWSMVLRLTGRIAVQ